MKTRLKQILDERHNNFAAYQKDAWKYFDEFIPHLESTVQDEIKRVIEAEPVAIEFEEKKSVGRPKKK